MKPLSLLCILLLAAACSSPNPDQIKRSFDKVNSSLTRSSYETLRHKYQDAYNLIQTRTDSLSAVLEANELYTVTENAVQYMEQLKHRLSAMDSVGDKTKPVGQLLLHTPTSDSLRNYLLFVCSYAYKDLLDKEQIRSFDSTLYNIGAIITQKDWTEVYFRKASTKWTLQMLSIFQINCLQAATPIFTSMAPARKKDHRTLRPAPIHALRHVFIPAPNPLSPADPAKATYARNGYVCGRISFGTTG